MTAVTFTVVVPAHDAAATVVSALRSVLDQTRQDFEVVVVDDGSTDDTAARVEQVADPRVRLLRQAQQGPAGARNAGIRAARGRFVSLLDADDLWLPGYLEAMERALDADPEAGFAYTDAWVLDGATGRIRRTTAMAGTRSPPSAPPLDPRDLMLMLAERNFVYTAATIRRDVLAAVGGYDERLRHGEDLELWLRIAGAGHRAVRADGVLAIHRDHEGSLTGRAEHALARAVALYATIAREHQDEAVRRIARERERALARHLRRLTEPTPLQRVETAVRRLRERVAERSLWLDEPPAEVARTLARADR